MGKFYDASSRTPSYSSTTFKNRDVYVAPSAYLKNIGYGLYANRDYGERDIIQEYKGGRLTHRQALEMEADQENTQAKNYLFEVNNGQKVNHVIDGSDERKTSAVRFANSTKTWKNKSRNAEFVQYKKRVYMIASRPIKQHSEIITYYGEHTTDIIKN